MSKCFSTTRACAWGDIVPLRSFITTENYLSKRWPVVDTLHKRLPKMRDVIISMSTRKSNKGVIVLKQRKNPNCSIEQLLYGIPYQTILNFANRLTSLNAASVSPLKWLLYFRMIMLLFALFKSTKLFFLI